MGSTQSTWDTHQEHLAQPLSTPPPRMDECIKHCEHCHRQCLKTQTHCTMLGGKHVAPDHLKLLADCVEICRVSADFMVRGSPRHHLTCHACAAICERCAEDCERVGPQDKMMLDCAKACRECAAMCRERPRMRPEHWRLSTPTNCALAVVVDRLLPAHARVTLTWPFHKTKHHAVRPTV